MLHAGERVDAADVLRPELETTGERIERLSGALDFSTSSELTDETCPGDTLKLVSSFKVLGDADLAPSKRGGAGLLSGEGRL